MIACWQVPTCVMRPTASRISRFEILESRIRRESVLARCLPGRLFCRAASASGDFENRLYPNVGVAPRDLRSAEIIGAESAVSSMRSRGVSEKTDLSPLSQFTWWKFAERCFDAEPSARRFDNRACGFHRLLILSESVISCAPLDRVVGENQPVPWLCSKE